MSSCTWIIEGDEMRCPTCGRPTPRIDDPRGIERTCRGPQPVTAPPEPPGLGDRVESVLTAFGITKERVERWVGQPCGCAERQQKLNRLGEWAAAAVERGKEWAASKLEELTG